MKLIPSDKVERIIFGYEITEIVPVHSKARLENVAMLSGIKM